MKNLWLGVSIEDQASADYSIRCCSRRRRRCAGSPPSRCSARLSLRPRPKGERCLLEHPHDGDCKTRGLDWVVVGGESGPGARPFDMEWGRADPVEQCRDAKVPVFVKQVGARPVLLGECLPFSCGPKGGDPPRGPSSCACASSPWSRGGVRVIPDTLPDELCAELMLFRDPVGVIGHAMKNLGQYELPQYALAHFQARVILMGAGMEILHERDAKKILGRCA
jgi:hypothetical protein